MKESTEDSKDSDLLRSRSSYPRDKDRSSKLAEPLQLQTSFYPLSLPKDFDSSNRSVHLDS